MSLTRGDGRFDAFVRAHRDRAVRMARRLCGDDDAADVAQGAFLRATIAIHTVRDPERLEAWFFRTLVYHARNHRRWRAVRERFAGPWREPAAQQAPDPDVKDRVRKALDALPAGQREAFVLVHLEGFTVVEAADLVGSAPGTIKSHLHRALTALRTSLADLDPGAP